MVIRCSILVFFLAFCTSACDLILTSGHPLAVLQDSLIKRVERGETIPESTLDSLQKNLWIRQSYRIAPSNLVIRQYCIIDMIVGKARHKRRIRRQLDLLSKYDRISPYRTFAEGYSYWAYTQEALQPWVDKFGKLGGIVAAIDSGFAYTAYLGPNDTYYPAPFGDLRYMALEGRAAELAPHLSDQSRDVTCHNVFRSKQGFLYMIKPMPVGLNGHCDKEARTYEVKDGLVQGFDWYQGYDKKYEDEVEEWKDLLNPIRILSIPFLR